MNKTVLLACCDFLILATLALMTFNKSSEKENLEVMKADSSFQVVEEDEDNDELVEAYYIQKLKDLQYEQAKVIQQLALEKQESVGKDEKIKQLQNELSKHKKSIYKTILGNLWQINVSMKEDDSFRPDLFKTDFFSCSFEIEDRIFLLADFEKLGFQWSELISDGNISQLKVTLAKSGPNPWSTVCKTPILSLNQDPGICMIPMPKNKVYSPLPVLPSKNIPEYLENIYAAKSDGRIIKVRNVSIIPNSPQWLTIDEERFLGHPDKVQKGDILLTNHGHLIGMISKESNAGNKRRLYSHIFSEFNLEENSEIPLLKKSSDDYFVDFVSKTRHISKNLRSQAK